MKVIELRTQNAPAFHHRVTALTTNYTDWLFRSIFPHPRFLRPVFLTEMNFSESKPPYRASLLISFYHQLTQLNQMETDLEGNKPKS